MMKASTKYAAVGLILGLVVVGLFGVPYILSVAKQPAPAAPPGTAPVWQVAYNAATPGSHAALANTATITESLSADQKVLDWYDTAANWITTVAGNTFTMVADLLNKNVGDTNVAYSMSVAVSSVSTVSDQNAGTSSPLVLKDANGFWTVVYTDTGADFTQFQDKATVVLTTGLADTLTATFTIGAGAFNAFIAGSVYSVVMSYAGVSLTLNFHAL
jgi:hypothetical protein